MTAIVWDQVGERTYENGLDRGVLYVPGGSGVPWNGLISMVENANKTLTSIYFDGRKTADYVAPSDFSGTLKAFTYPDEFLQHEGVAEIGPGVFVADQRPTPFSLSYRTKIGNDIDGGDHGYKIHILYNLTAIPSNKNYETLSDDPDAAEFEWKITAVPQEVFGHKPTAHIIIDSRRIDPFIMAELEASLYGTDSMNAQLISFDDLMELSIFAVTITNNGDGTWTATTDRDGYITDDGSTDGIFELENVTATYLDAVTYSLSDTFT